MYSLRTLLVVVFIAAVVSAWTHRLCLASDQTHVHADA